MTPVVPDVVASGLNDQNFKLHRGHWFGFGVLGLLMVVLAVLMFQNEDKTDHSMTVLIDSVGITSNLLVVQSESLQLGSAYERWLSGTTTGFNLKIRREDLAQPLIRFINDSHNYDRLVGSRYLNALGALDNFIDAAPPGVLTPAKRIVQRANSADPLKTFIYESKTFAEFGSLGVDERTRRHIRDENTRRTSENTVILVILLLIILVTGLLGYSGTRDFRRIRARLDDERHQLEQTNVALKRVDDELKIRIDKERMDRSDREWIDSTVNLVSLQMEGTVIPDEIADTMVEALGRTLKVDFVIFYSYGKFRRDELWRQWSQTPATQIDFSRIAKYESSLLGFVKNLGKGSHAIVVSDTRLIDVSRGPFPEIVAISKELARSFILVPVGEEIHGLGYVWMGMKEEVRVWSPNEVELIQQVASDSAQALAHAWMFGQTMQIAENEAMVNRLIELDKVKNDFIENMNHELRTPLTSIIGYMEMIMGDVDSDVEPELVASLSVVQRNALRLQSLIVNMMQIPKMDFENQPLDISTVDIGHMLDDAIKSMELAAANSGIKVTLRLDSPSDELLIDGDINQLQQVFVNLLSNAVKFTPRGGEVTVVARRVHTDRSDCVEVTVTDTGIGIPPEEFPNVFKRFFRATTATQSSIPGFGIGLSLVHLIVGAHHGTITFDSTVGKGTVFTVKLPARFVSTEVRDQLQFLL